MSPRALMVRYGWSGFPRTRGDEPPENKFFTHSYAFSPHARG